MFIYFLVALGSVSYAMATSMARIYLKGFDPLGLATAQLSLAILLLLPVAAFVPAPAGITAKALLAVAALAIWQSVSGDWR